MHLRARTGPNDSVFQPDKSTRTMNISCVRDMQRLRAMTLSVSPKSGVERVVYIQVLYPYTEAAGVLRLPKSAAALRPKSGVETVVCIQVLSIYGGCGCLRLPKSAAALALGDEKSPSFSTATVIHG